MPFGLLPLPKPSTLTASRREFAGAYWERARFLTTPMTFNKKNPPPINTASTAVPSVSNLPASCNSLNCNTTKVTAATFRVRTHKSAHPAGVSMLSQCFGLFVMLRPLFLYNRLGGRLLQELCGAQQKLVKPDPFHAHLHAHGDLTASPESDQRLGRLGVRSVARHPRPALLRRALGGQVTPRAWTEDILVGLVDRVRELYIHSVRLRLTLR